VLIVCQLTNELEDRRDIYAELSVRNGNGPGLAMLTLSPGVAHKRP
jgi:hypothetical protein